jgi:hypothetical protein
MLSLLAGSDHVVLAIDKASGDVVGFITALSDGVLCAYISFLEVVPGYRQRGDRLRAAAVHAGAATPPVRQRSAVRPGASAVLRVTGHDPGHVDAHPTP